MLVTSISSIEMEASFKNLPIKARREVEEESWKGFIVHRSRGIKYIWTIFSFHIFEKCLPLMPCGTTTMRSTRSRTRQTDSAISFLGCLWQKFLGFAAFSSDCTESLESMINGAFSSASNGREGIAAVVVRWYIGFVYSMVDIFQRMACGGGKERRRKREKTSKKGENKEMERRQWWNMRSLSKNNVKQKVAVASEGRGGLCVDRCVGKSVAPRDFHRDIKTDFPNNTSHTNTSHAHMPKIANMEWHTISFFFFLPLARGGKVGVLGGSWPFLEKKNWKMEKMDCYSIKGNFLFGWKQTIFAGFSKQNISFKLLFFSIQIQITLDSSLRPVNCRPSLLLLVSVLVCGWCQMVTLEVCLCFFVFVFIFFFLLMIGIISWL